MVDTVRTVDRGPEVVAARTRPRPARFRGTCAGRGAGCAGYAPAPAGGLHMNAPLDAIAQHAQNFGDRTAVVVDASGGARPSTTTFAEMNVLVNQLAHGLLAAGARP